MALRVERSLQQPQDPLQRWRHGAFPGGGSRPDALRANPLLGTNRRPALQPSRRVLERSGSVESYRPAPVAQKEMHEQQRPAGQPSSPQRPSHPPAKTLAAGRVDRPPQFLQISSLLNPRTGVKRRRSRLDVDGPDTAGLSFKKRRLRFQHVTSRLSQPYSHPATHIHCSQDVGRASPRKSPTPPNPANATRPGPAPRVTSPSPHATSFLRFSIMNRMRKRLGLKGPGPIKVDRGDPGFVGLDAASQTAWHRQGAKQEPEVQQATSWTPSTAAKGPGLRAVSKRPEQRPLAKEKPLHQVTKTSSQSSFKSTVLPVSSSDPATVDRDVSSPAQAPTPQPRPPRNTYDLFEDSFAFMHSDGEPFGDLAEEPDEVYCDFSVLFSKAQSPSSCNEDRIASVPVDGHDSWPLMVT